MSLVVQVSKREKKGSGTRLGEAQKLRECEEQMLREEEQLRRKQEEALKNRKGEENQWSVWEKEERRSRGEEEAKSTL